jgi:hypothetical protein
MTETKLMVYKRGQVDPDRFDCTTNFERFIEQLGALESGDTATVFVNHDQTKASFEHICEFIVQPAPNMYEEMLQVVTQTVTPFLTKEQQAIVNEKIMAIAKKHELVEVPPTPTPLP